MLKLIILNEDDTVRCVLDTSGNYNVHDCNPSCTFAHSLGELKIHKCKLNNCLKTIHCHCIHSGESINEFYKRLQYIPPNTNNPDSCKEEQRFYDLKKKVDEINDKLQELIDNSSKKVETEPERETCEPTPPTPTHQRHQSQRCIIQMFILNDNFK